MPGERPLRILMLNYEFPPMGGGAGHASAQLARGLAARGCRVDVVTSGLAGQPSREETAGVVVHRVRSRRKSVQECGFHGAWSYVAAAQPLMRRLLREQRFDVIHYFFGLPTGALSLCTPGAGRVPSVVSLRGSDVPGYDRHSRGLQVAHALLHPVTRLIWRGAGAVVANSAWLGRLAGQAIPGVPVDVIPNAVEEPFSPSATNGRVRDCVQLLAVVRLIPRKGVDELLQAMALLREEPVRLSIQGQGSHADAFQRVAVSLGVDERVSFDGFKPRHLLPAVYQAADLFVLPSRSESCSMALLEAMACGLPVVATRAGGTEELIDDGVNGLLVPSGDVPALAQALRRLIRDPALRGAMGSANAARARTRHGWDAVVEAYLAAYRRAMKAHQRNGAARGTG